jgi:hypothetical protein
MFNFATKSTQFTPGKILGGADFADSTSYRTLFCGKWQTLVLQTPSTGEWLIESIVLAL